MITNTHVTFGTETICTCVMSSKYDYDMIPTMRTKKLVLIMMMMMMMMINNNVDSNLERKA